MQTANPNDSLPRRANAARRPEAPESSRFRYNGALWVMEPIPEFFNVVIAIPLGSTATQSATFNAPFNLVVRHITAQSENGDALRQFSLGWKEANDVVDPFPKANENGTRIYPPANTLVSDASAAPIRRWDAVFLQNMKRTFYSGHYTGPAAATNLHIVLHTYRISRVREA